MNGAEILAWVGIVLLASAVVTWGVAEISDIRRDRAQRDRLDDWSR